MINTINTFYDEINNNNIKDINEDNNNVNEDRICLISGETLNNTQITLECNHKFNYFYIFNEIVNQKNIKNKYSKVLKINEIKCPYCRTIQKKILPFKNIPKCDTKIHGVNYPKKYCMKNNPCCYIFKRGIKKGTQCSKESIDLFCREHLKYKSDEKYNLNTCITINS